MSNFMQGLFLSFSSSGFCPKTFSGLDVFLFGMNVVAMVVLGLFWGNFVPLFCQNAGDIWA